MLGCLSGRHTAGKGHVASGASRLRMYTKQGGKYFHSNKSYCHVAADLGCAPKQTFHVGLTEVAHDEQMTSLPAAPRHAGISCSVIKPSIVILRQ